MMEEYIKNLAIECFENSTLAENLRNVMDKYEKAMVFADSIQQKAKEKDLTEIKIGTILTLKVVDKISKGQNINDFSDDDWKEIANAVAKYAILTDDSVYSAFVFELYAKYIEASAARYEGILSEKTIKDLRDLAQDIHNYTELFKNGEIYEVAYIEECLWLCLEGIIKLLSAALTLVFGKELNELAQAVAVLGIEYAKNILYKREQELLAEYLEHQRVLDEELQCKYNAFLNDLQDKTNEFNKLIDEAFNSDFRYSLRSSVKLARAAGVAESEILKTVDDIDDFFLN